MPAFPTPSTFDLDLSKRFYVEGLGFRHVFTIPGPDGQPIVEHIRFTRYADVLLERDPPDLGRGTSARGVGVRVTFSLPSANRGAEEFAEHARRYGVPVEGPLDDLGTSETWS